ncbi:hypothetical protein AOC36_08360 [Erysipelothrix larvae]|uniref:Mga helix-turn-helix domain-containing protein n=1 Tax=Erysipelothrix larvae TaxID=1514105 RepID=A0A0X8H0V4_9FIRM|nr:hypothetical protein [Erysipelothrix larvae]AMC93998.1 hypothetical protein AOC36_08360 [Erysipelothrix larvae]
MLLKYKKQVYRLANILDLLIKNDRVISIAEIAAVNQCVERTVYNDIYYLIDNYNDLIELDFSHSNIVSSHTSVGNIQFIYENIIACQPRTRLLRLIIERPNMPIDFYANEINKSPQSTRKLMCDFDDILRHYEMKLNDKRLSYEIVGEEDKV